MNPEYLEEAKNVDEDATLSLDLKPQYRIIRSGPNSETSSRKAIKEKAKAKPKPTVKINTMPQPNAISHASGADVVAIN